MERISLGIALAVLGVMSKLPPDANCHALKLWKEMRASEDMAPKFGEILDLCVEHRVLRIYVAKELLDRARAGDGLMRRPDADPDADPGV